MALQAKVPSPPAPNQTLELKFGEKKESTEELRTSVFPAEWFPQSAVQLTWPHEETDWKEMLEEVTETYIRIAFEIASREELIIVAPEAEKVESLLKEKLPKRVNENIRYFSCPTNDTWARDHAFISVFTQGELQLLDFCFNGWGNKFEAQKDNEINRSLFSSGLIKGNYKDCLSVVLEGGSIESDGQGTLLTTSSCLLSKERNPNMSKNEIEEYLKKELHSERVLWLDYGELEGDDTDGHIDTLARFCSKDTISYVKCYDSQDTHFLELSKMEKQLESFRTASGEPYNLLPLPLPEPIIFEGERLPATYANFLIVNGAVLVPTYSQKEKDEMAVKAIQKAFPKLEVVGIDCCSLIKQHGSLHCSAMQYPKS